MFQDRSFWENIVSASSHRKFILRNNIKLDHPLTSSLTDWCVYGGEAEAKDKVEIMHGSYMMLIYFVNANVSMEVKYSEKFPLSSLFIMISAASHQNSKLRFSLFEMFHLRRMAQNPKKGICLTIVVKSDYSVSLLSSSEIFKLESQEGQREK